MRVVDTTLERITIRRHGDSGPCVHVLHGGPGAPGSAQTLAEALADSFRVHEPLQRRSGEVPLTVAQHVADLDAVIEENTLLVGWSWGAMLALSYTTTHPAKVRGVALVGCGTYDAPSRAAYQQAMQERLTPRDREELNALRRAMAKAEGAEERDALFARIGAIDGRAQSVDLLHETDADMRADAGGYETWPDVLRLQDEGVEPQAFTTITAPVILFQGERDPHPGKLTYDCLHAYMPQLVFVEIPDSGHAPWLERAGRERFLSGLTAWLSAVGEA
jgi:pimeloyl-ACP methyl ester carboxylesterase